MNTNRAVIAVCQIIVLVIACLFAYNTGKAHADEWWKARWPTPCVIQNSATPDSPNISGVKGNVTITVSPDEGGKPR
jgi:hypothetical protein